MEEVFGDFLQVTGSALAKGVLSLVRGFELDFTAYGDALSSSANGISDLSRRLS